MAADPQPLAYRALIDVNAFGRKTPALEVFHLPGGENIDPRVALLLTAGLIERAPEFDGTESPDHGGRR